MLLGEEEEEEELMKVALFIPNLNLSSPSPLTPSSASSPLFPQG